MSSALFTEKSRIWRFLLVDSLQRRLQLGILLVREHIIALELFLRQAAFDIRRDALAD